jgi:hypothetical protein
MSDAVTLKLIADAASGAFRDSMYPVIFLACIAAISSFFVEWKSLKGSPHGESKTP